MLTNKTLQRVLILSVTGLPGVHKLLVLFFVGYLYGASELGAFINDSFIIQILAIFTAFSWSNIILADIHKFNNKLKTRFYSKITFFSFVYCLFFIFIILTLHYFDWIIDWKGSILFLITFTLYQLWRNYYVTSHLYWEVFILDSTLIILSILAVYIKSSIDVSLISLQSIPYIVPVIYLYIKENIPLVLSFKLFKGSFDYDLNKRAIQNAFSNFSTASISLFIAPISFRLLSSEYTAVIGVFNNISNVMILIPRSIAMHNIPLLAKAYRSKNRLQEIFKKYQEDIFKVLGLLLIISLLLIFCFKYISYLSTLINNKLPYIYTICILMFISSIISQIALPISNLVIITRQEGIILRVNSIAFFLFIIFFLLGYTIHTNGIFLIILYQGLLIIQHVIRFRFLTIKYMEVAHI